MSKIISNPDKEYYFLLYLISTKENKSDLIKFTTKENCLKSIFTKVYKSGEEKDKLIKIYKYTEEIKEKSEIEFSYDGKNYKIILEPKNRTFIFNVNLQQKGKVFGQSTIEQNALANYEIMDFFIESLNKINESNKIDILYQDSIKLYSKKPNFQFLICIFIHVYNTNLCEKILNEFSKNFDKPNQKDNIIKESLDQYKYYFDDICENTEDIISSNSLNKFDFYGLVLSYLNNYMIDKYQEKFNELYKNQKDVLFEVLLKYKLYFKKQIDLSLDILDEIIKFTTKKNFDELKNNGIFYLKDVITFLDIIEKNKEEIIKIKNFKPIEIPQFDDKEIDFKKLTEKVGKILEFSNNKNLILINFKSYFWDNIAKKSPQKTIEDIKIFHQLREKLVIYNTLVNNVFKEDKENPIKKEINGFYKKGVFIRQLDERIKNYIEQNDKVRNLEIIDLIKNYDVYYKDGRYKNKRNPEILKRINLETIDDDFKETFKNMEFETIFEDDLENYVYILLEKIEKIEDFDIILELININKLGKIKSKYLNNLINKYKIAIKKSLLSDINPKIIKSIANLAYFMSINESEKNLYFLKNIINSSELLDKNLKHKIYLQLIGLCNNNKQENIINFISEIYLQTLKKDNLNEFVDFILSLTEEKSNNLIENFDDKYNIIEEEYYSIGESLNIKLLSLIKQKLKLKEDNKYIKSNTKVLEKIYTNIENKEIKFEYLNNFCNDKKETVMEKLNILCILQEHEINPDGTYLDFRKYYEDMENALQKLSDYKSKLELYHQETKKDEISDMEKKIEMIIKGTYNSYYHNRFDIKSLLEGLKDTIDKINDINKSKIFKIFFQSKKLSKDKKIKENPFDEAYSEFIKFKKLLAEKGKNFVNEENKNEYVRKIISESQQDSGIQKELYSLINGGEKTDDEINLILNSKIYEIDLKSMFYFLDKFKKIKKEIGEWIEKCFEIHKNDFSEMKIKSPPEIINTLKELKEKDLYDYIKELNITKKSNYIKVFNSFFDNNQGLDFLNNNNTDDIKQLYDKVDPTNKTITMKDISYTINCIGYFQELKEKNSLKEIIGDIKTKMENEDFYNAFDSFSKNYRSIIELNRNFDFSLSIYEEISKIINNAKFYFNKNDEEFKYKINDNEYKNIKIEEIRVLKNKIQIKKEGKTDSMNSDSDKFYDKYKKLEFFKELSNCIEDIYSLMNILRIKGSTLPISIRVEVAYPEKNFYIGESKESIEFKELQNYLSKAKTNIIKKLDSIYKQMTTIRFIYGKQIDSILTHIQANYKIDSFLRYILNLTDCKKEIKEGKKFFNRNVKNFVIEYDRYNDNSFSIIHNYILSLFRENNLSIEDHYKNISIKKGLSIKGIYIYLSQSISMEEDILQIFLDKIGKIPIAQNILINSKETSYEEMQAFYHRAILCKYNTLFVVKVSDSISDYQKRCMNFFIDKLLTYKNEEFNRLNGGKEVGKNETSKYMNSCLVFVYNKDSESFLNELKNFKPEELSMQNINHAIRRTLTLENLSISSSAKDPLREELHNNTHIIQSEVCGLGKTIKIKNLIEKSNKKYIYFPLGGNLTKDKIYHKLEKIMKNIPSENNYTDIAIHLDLFESKEHSVLNEFLFSFLITKFYSNNENIIYIPINIEIYIEIPNCFNDFIGNYNILKFFKKDYDNITLNNIPELNLPKEKIELFNKMLGLGTNEQIYKWIKNNIKLPRYSYHQIHIFINLFIGQYNKFGGKKLKFFMGKKDITDECISSFSEGTKYFTYGGFSQLLLENKHKVDSETDDIDLLSDEYDNDLKKENFDKKLIFIIKNKLIYYNLDISTKALENGEALGKLNEEETKKRNQMKNENPEKLEKLEYLGIIKQILDLENPIESEENTPKKKGLPSLMDILKKDNYVITIDNFRKMILILYRIVANIPVILMGETGCGKTALIKKLNQFFYNGKENLKIINVDPSYDEEKLTTEIKKINEEAKIYNQSEIWLFLDELNTCDSMALITEIFINRSYGGVKLSDNIRLIGACNPYRKKRKNTNICGLTHPNSNENQLVYLVNILPQSLMYYVFNFGSLEKKNEDQYISSIISDTFENKILKEKTKNVISKCHKYLRDIFDPSVVSLREMTRFKKIYNFFIKYYKKKCKYLKMNGNEESEKLKSIIIAVYLCYYIRLVDGSTRTNFDTELTKEFRELVNYNFDKNLNQGKYKEDDLIYPGDFKDDLQNNYKITDVNKFIFSEILDREEKFLLDNIKLEPGIGGNKSLKENIFLLFTSLNTSIPLIIIGKPGSSKSLSAQLIMKAMNGKYSKGKFFRSYNSIIQSYFQGSDSTTPEEVNGIFKIAEDRLKALKGKDKNSEIPISMILFDELGLAEKSKYNPLKVLHSHLEMDGNKKGISFVGISNWTLDAAKINRTLNSSVPDLDSDIDGLKDTSISIVTSINGDFENRPIFAEIIPNVYFNYKHRLKILKKLTVYKKYELQQYKYILYKYREDKEFQKIFSDKDDYEICKKFFTKEKGEKEENFETIFGHKKFKEVKNEIKLFFENKKQKFLDNPFESEDFKKLYENDRTIKEEFHGNRDFYYLIKGIANEINENNNSNLQEVVKRHIERNFGGIDIIIDFEDDFEDLNEMEEYKSESYKEFFEDISREKRWSSVQIFKKIYNLYCKEKKEIDYIMKEKDIDDYNYINNIIDNIKDTKSRYLLLEIKPSLASLIYQKISKEIKNYKNTFFFEGSPFVNDNNEEYQFKIINQIQEQAENDHLLILQNLNQIYAFLYDLFNKNFIIKDGKFYARICHGNFYDQYTHINEEFRTIIMVNKKYLENVDPPFLSRFEKMILSFDKLISKKQRDLADEISGKLDMKTFVNKYDYQINYELKDLLIGCRKEDILGMVYYELDSNESTYNKEKNDDESIKKKILNKIYKLLPQDIIVNLDKNNPLREIYYNKKIHYNLESFLNQEKTLSKISIIYTFHSITNVIVGIDESSSYKMISEIKSEIQLISIINSMISERFNDTKIKKSTKYKNLIFIHFDGTNSKKIGFLISFVKNNYYKNIDLKFVFIVHVKRNFYIQQNKEKNLDKIFAVPDINLDIYQIFIDNLNGPNIILKDILEDPVQKLLDDGQLKIEDEFNKSLRQFTNENLKNLYGEDDEIDFDNYSKKLEEYFENDRNLMNNIIKKIKKYINEEKKSSSDIIKNIYNYNYINKNSIDLITVIIEYSKKEIISKYVNIILCKLEDNNILTTLLVIKNNKNLKEGDLEYLYSEMVEKYLDSIKIEENKCKPKFNLSFVIPGFYEFYPKLSDFIYQNIRNDFLKNERKLRNFLTGDKYETKQKYYKIEEDLLNIVYDEIGNNKFIFEYINKIPSNLLLNDYITFYLIKYYTDGDEENLLNYNNLSYKDCKHDLINLIINIRFDEKKSIFEKNKNNSLKLLLMKINWIESNQDYIIKILKIYDILKNIYEENQFVKIIENTLNNEKLRYITNEKKNPDITTEVNECFYKIIASICYSIIPPSINFKKIIGTYDYLESVKNAIKIIKSINDELYLFSIEVDLIEELIQIYEILELNEKLDGEKLNEICLSLKRNNDILTSHKEIQSEELIEEFKKLYGLINRELKYNDIKYYDLLKYICYKEIKKVPNISYRTAIFQDVIKDIEIIINSNDILQILLFPLVNPNKTKFQNSIIEILTSTDYDIAAIIEYILEKKNEEVFNALEDTLLYYFEKNSLMYFNNIFHGKEKILLENDEEKPIYGPLKMFKECIKFLNNFKKGSHNIEGKNKNLCKLFCIGYIKSYCFTYFNLLDTCSPKLENDLKIINEVNNSKCLSKVISFFIWKIIYNKNNKNIDIFIDPEFIKKFKFSEYKCFKKVESTENPFTYNYINQKDKDIYNEFNKVLEKYKNTKFEKVDLEEFNPNKIDMDLFFFSTSNMILSNLKQKHFTESPIYINFYKNVCTPLFKNKEKLFNAIKILYESKRFEKLRNELGLTPDNLNVILHSYRYFINELNSPSNNSIYNIFYGRYLSIKKINDNYFPGNDIKDIPIYSIYSKIKNHFKEIPNQGCFVCLCQRGGYYHSIKGGIPGIKYLDLKCSNCDEKIGSYKNERGFIKPIKRENYFRIFKTDEESEKDKKRNYGNYNCMGFNEFQEKYIFDKFKEDKGISKSDESFFKKDTKIVRFLSQISYRILNFILYSHLFFSKIYNNNDELDIFLPKNMSWIKVLSESWEMIKIELNKFDINAINIFMNYIFSDLFSTLNKHKNITEYDELIELEKNLDELIQNKIKDFKDEYKNFNKLSNYDSNDKFFFQNIIDERYKELNEDEYPFYNYFYYSEYINEEYLLNKLNHIEKDKYPVLLKVLEMNNSNENKIKYSLENLPIFNEVLNLFEDKYSYIIKRDKANKLRLKDIKDEEIYINNRNSIKNFIEFFNSLQLKNEKGDNILKLTEENSKLSELFIDDDNEISKSYKDIYSQFIKEQNNQISDLLDNKIKKGIFEKDCKNKISIQSANSNEIFITNLTDKFSFIETVFSCSYRKYAITKDYDTYNQIEINFDLLEDKMTEILLRNKKLFNDSISNFVYANEDLKFENTNLITTFNNEYEIENINLADKLILYKFYQDNQENEILFKTIFEDFIQLITFLNYNKKLLKDGKKNAIILKDNEKISECFKSLGQKVSENFQNLFKDKDLLLISKTTGLFEYYRNLIFKRIKSQLSGFQIELEEDKKVLIEQILKEQSVITKKIFKSAIRSFIMLFLNFEKDIENNIKENQNNIINYFDIPDLWEKNVYNNNEFSKELKNIKKGNIKINQIIPLYNYLGEDIDEEFFQEEKRAIEKEKEIKKIEEKEEPPKEEIPSDKDDDDDDDDNYERKSEDNERDYV